MKPWSGEALGRPGSEQDRSVLVVRRTGQEAAWTEGRDVWWHGLVGRRPERHTGRPCCARLYEHLRRHDRRHTGPTWFADAGVPVHILRRTTGHGSPTTSRRCLHADVHKITAADAALSAHPSVLRAPYALSSPIAVTRQGRSR
nr:hypothetical protein [Streptomyces sp. NK08204]